MKLQNFEIANINSVLAELSEQKITGRLKFKMLKTKRACEGAVELLSQALDGVEDQEERLEILNEEQDIEVNLFTMDEMDVFPLSMRDLSVLESIIDLENEEEK